VHLGVVVKSITLQLIQKVFKSAVNQFTG